MSLLKIVIGFFAARRIPKIEAGRSGGAPSQTLTTQGRGTLHSRADSSSCDDTNSVLPSNRSAIASGTNGSFRMAESSGPTWPVSPSTALRPHKIKSNSPN